MYMYCTIPQTDLDAAIQVYLYMYKCTNTCTVYGPMRLLYYPVQCTYMYTYSATITGVTVYVCMLYMYTCTCTLYVHVDRIYRVLFYGTLWSFVRFPLELLST